MKKIIIIALAALLAAAAATIGHRYTARLKAENESLTATKTALLDSVRHYRTENGLQAAQTAQLRLSVDDLKRYRAEDLRLIESLKNVRGRDVERLVTVNTVTHDTIATTLRDTLLVHDTVPTPAKKLDVRTRWYDLQGEIEGGRLNARLTTRSSLKIVETVRYKRFLGFLWKTSKVKDRKVDVVSLNPNERIDSVEFIVVER